MFPSMEKLEETKYENEMRNFFKLKKNCNDREWRSILDEDNSTAFDTEMTETLVNVNRFITKIEIESRKLIEKVSIQKENEKLFKEYLALGRELLTKLKMLATLEKATAMEKYEQSHVRKLSYAATEDTTSGVDTESVADVHGMFSKEESLDRRDSRMITLVHKYAATFTKHYEIFDKLNHNVEEVVTRFNNILDFIHQQLQERSGLHARNEISPAIDEKELLRFSKKMNASEIPSSNEKELCDEFAISSELDSKSVTDLLFEHFQNSTVSVVYKHVGTSGVGHLIEHTYGCIAASLYVEGKSRKKNKAKEMAAIEMIKQIIKCQKLGNLPNNIIPFNELQLHELSAKLTEREDFIEKLEEKCLHSHEPPPLYDILSETGKNNEAYYTVKCEAMGYTALGHGADQYHAKKNAAKSILNLVTKRKKSSLL